MTPQERDNIIGIIADVYERLDSTVPQTARSRLLELESYVRTMASAHTRETAVWITRDDQVIRIVDIDDDHLLNIERAIVAGTASATEVDRENITRERERRGLKALRPRQPMEDRISKNLTDFHAIYKRANKSTRQHILRGLATLLREAAASMNEEDALEVNHAADVIETTKPGDAQPLTRRDMKDLMFGEKWGGTATLTSFIERAIRPEITQEEAEALRKTWNERWPDLANYFDGLIQRPPNIDPALAPHIIAEIPPNPNFSPVSPETLAAVKSLSDRRLEIRDLLKRGEITRAEAHAEFPETF